MRNTLLFILFFCSTISLSAEVISGPANIRIEPQKEIIVSLNDSVVVGCSKIEGGWYQIGFTVVISKDVYEQQGIIKKGEKLIDFDGRTIGIAINNIPLTTCYSWSSGGSPGNPIRYGMEIFGYTHYKNVFQWSIPENPLNSLLIENKNNLVRSIFTKYISDFKFMKSEMLDKLVPNLTEFEISDCAVDDPSPMERIRLIFEDQKLIAIVHSRALKITDIKTVSLNNDLLLSIFALPKNMDKKTFIKLNNHAYDGGD